MTGARYVRIKRFAELTGYTEKAVYRKIADGVWIHVNGGVKVVHWAEQNQAT